MMRYLAVVLMLIGLTGCAGWGTISVYRANADGQMELTEEWRFNGKNIKASGGDNPTIETKDLIPDLPKIEID